MKKSKENKLNETLADFKARVSLREQKLKEAKEEYQDDSVTYSLLQNVLHDKWDSIQQLNAIMASIKNEDILSILKEIAEEEYIHIGQLEKAMVSCAPITDAETLIDQGQDKASELLELDETQDETPVEESLKESLIPNEDLLNKLIDVFAFDEVNKVVTKDNKYVLLVDKSDNKIVGYLKVNDLKTKDFDELFKLLNNQNKISGIIKNKYKSELTESNEELLGEAIKNKWKTEFYYDGAEDEPEEIWFDNLQYAKEYCTDEIEDNPYLVKVNILKSSNNSSKVLNTWSKESGWANNIDEGFIDSVHDKFVNLQGKEFLEEIRNFSNEQNLDFKRVLLDELKYSDHAGEYNFGDVKIILNENGSCDEYELVDGEWDHVSTGTLDSFVDSVTELLYEE